MKKILYLFVEGPDDEKYFLNFMKECLMKCFNVSKIRCIKYRKRGFTAKQIEKEIKTIGKHDYLFIGDLDRNNFTGANSVAEKRRELINIYKTNSFTLPDDKVWIVVNEIESWYLAGFDENFCSSNKLKYIKSTASVAKEDFDKIEILQRGKRKRKEHEQIRELLIKKKAAYSFDVAFNRDESNAFKNIRNKSLTDFCKDLKLRC